MAKNFEPGDHQREISDIRIKTGGGLVARSLFGMGWSLASTIAKLIAVSSPAADAFSPDPVRRNGGSDGHGGSGTDGVAVAGVDAIERP